MAQINAVKRVRAMFKEVNVSLTLAQISEKTGLKANEVSMAMCYFMRQGQASRVLIDNTKEKSRKQVWLYTYGEAKNAL